jgi:CubicO group peptidase (beta-lactamase class C family)
LTGIEADQIRATVEEVMARARVPGIVVVVARAEADIARLIVGSDTGGVPLAEDTLFPVASITKLATALAVLRLVADGRLDLDDPLHTHLPDAVAAVGGVTIRTLLCHTSGLPDDLPDGMAPYRQGLTWPDLARACLQVPQRREANTRVEYSNVGYGLLALVVERRSGLAFPEALRSLVTDPLGVEAYLGTEPPRAPARLTGMRGADVGTDLESFNSVFWRSLALPWSGLITTAGGALALMRAFLGIPAGFLGPQLLAEATRNQVGDLDCSLFGLIPWQHCHWGLGPEIRNGKTPHWTPVEASATSFGHAGQSGCVVWAEPSMAVTWAIMGTRTADNGWLLKQAPRIGAAILKAFME